MEKCSGILQPKRLYTELSLWMGHDISVDESGGDD